MCETLRANCFDASALVKLYVPELKSDILREYWGREPTKFTTSLCFYETISVLKAHHFNRGTIDLETYQKATLDLCSWFATVSESIKELHFLSPEIFFKAQKTAERYKLDLSDAFQLLSLQEGFFSQMRGESETILVTADKPLAEAARMEGLRVWYLMEEPIP